MITADVFQTLLLAWFKKNGRKHLPWQNPRTPYRVWLSEIMLQQTQVTTVIPYFNKFIEQFPDIATLATAPLDQVLHQWSGLGYYARARNLHTAAQIVTTQYQGILPKNLEALEALPGIGKSTAGAILALAFSQPATILEGNVKRVFCRLHGISGWPGTPSVMTTLWQLAQTYTSKSEPADYTQAIMDFGSLLCTRTQPKCHQCPMQNYCIAYKQKKISHYPTPKPPKKLSTRSIIIVVLINEQKNVFLEKNPPSGIWGGLWSLPQAPAEADIATWCQENYQCTVQTMRQHSIIKHSFTHFHLMITPIICYVKFNDIILIHEHGNRGWFEQRQVLQEKGLAAPIKKLIFSLSDFRDL